ncbi:MAG: hypothetical protein ACFFCW_18865 [Candidatus Hodarchaeota archaeon]
MAVNGPKKSSSPLTIITILAVLGGAYYVSQSQLKSSRPEAPTGLTHAVSEKDKIDARLWQDPLKVACEHDKTFHGPEKDNKYLFKIIPEPLLEDHERPIYAKEISESEYDVNESPAEHIISHVTDRISYINENTDKTVHILLTMIRDGISAEDHERRLRNRYAMVTALYSSGFVPEDPMHIQYFRLPWIDRNELEKKDDDGYRKIPKIGKDPNYTSEPLIVPYEWFEQEKVYLSKNDKDDLKYVLLVWLPEIAFSHWPLTRLAQVIEALGHKPNEPNSGVLIDMIGPSHSGTLQTMLSEIRDMNEFQPADDNCVDVNSTLEGLTIFSPWSTVSPALMVKDWICNDTNDISLSEMYGVIPDEFKKVGITFIRMIGSDDLLAMELINELKRRGVDVLNKEHHVALISEWDTFYGNAFALTFATMMESINGDTGPPYNWGDYMRDLNKRKHASSFPGNLQTYSYIRGIDGRLPESKSSKEEKSNEKSEESSKLTFTKGLELPAGRSQLDYIRRLTQKLSDKYEYFGKNELKAIGVVGSDVYDKLVLLHALREQFRDMIIFSIDIDTRMIHKEQLKWTRNLIVASNYGLELSDSYQSKIFQHRGDSLAPFRDNYQTSLFLACQTSLTPGKPSGILYRDINRENLAKIISCPQLFEIGRGRAVNLTVSGKKDVIDIHPSRIRRWHFGTLGNYMFLLMLAIVLFILLVNQISPRVKRWDSESIGLKLLFLSIIGLIWIVIYDHYREGGEPFSLDAGVSIWPGEILRFIAIILGVFLFVRLVNKLHESEERLAKEFRLERQEPEIEQHRANFRKRLKSRFTRKRLEGYCDWVFSLDWMPEFGETFVDAQKAWNDYLVKGKTFNRFRRLVPMALGYMVLSVVLINIFGLPNTPFRGNISFKASQYILSVSGIYLVILIFFVADASYISLSLTNSLIENRTLWPDKATKKIKEDPDIKLEDFAELLDVRFVTQLTEDIEKIIYWPLIVLVVMAIARHPYFDNWNFPISLIIAYAIASIYPIICAIKLQNNAKRVRAKALDYLNGRLFEARFGKNENRKLALKLTRMIREIESKREGAFRPFYENPVIHFIFGSGGMSLLALLKNMPLS